MGLERFLEIINNKEYEKLEYVNKPIAPGCPLQDNYINIYTKNGAFIRLSYDWYLKKTSFMHREKTCYYRINFFVPEENTSIATFIIEEDDYMFKTLNEIFSKLKIEINEIRINKYF